MNKIGFGFLRLPRTENWEKTEIDWPLLDQMVEKFLDRGGQYFDTAYTYLEGASEAAIKKSVVERYPRERIWLADKLPSWKIAAREDCNRYYHEQLERCGVTYFDTYLLHWINQKHYEIAERFDEFQFLSELKKSGSVQKIGFSYHDNAELLDQILTEHPEIDIVQLQINYLDWESTGVQSKKCYEVAKQHQKSVVVMEPVKGGTLVNLPQQAVTMLDQAQNRRSNAAWALAFAQSLKQVDVVLSGMNSMAQIEENMEQEDCLNDEEFALLKKIGALMTSQTAIPCTACGYCLKQCPKSIRIPQYFELYNEYARSPDEAWKIRPAYEQLTMGFGKASDCIQCGNCEKNCPQKIQIIRWLKQTKAALEQ